MDGQDGLLTDQKLSLPFVLDKKKVVYITITVASSFCVAFITFQTLKNKSYVKLLVTNFLKDHGDDLPGMEIRIDDSGYQLIISPKNAVAQAFYTKDRILDLVRGFFESRFKAT